MTPEINQQPLIVNPGGQNRIYFVCRPGFPARLL